MTLSVRLLHLAYSHVTVFWKLPEAALSYPCVSRWCSILNIWTKVTVVTLFAFNTVCDATSTLRWTAGFWHPFLQRAYKLPVSIYKKRRRGQTCISWLEKVNIVGISIAGELFSSMFSILTCSEPDSYCQFFSVIGMGVLVKTIT